MIEQNYRIDMIPDGAPVVVHISQYDTTARRLSFELYNGGVAYEIPTGAVASIAGTKPDGKAFLYAMTVVGNVASIDVQQQMALVAGDVDAEIQITGSDGKIGSANFVLRVERGPIDEDSVISETDLPIFEELVSEAQAAAEDAQTAADTASTAAESISEILPASAGTTGQILTKTATGADWGNPNATEIETFGGVGTAIKMASGNPVTIADALQGKALGINATLEPIQSGSGTPSPTNIRPITGRTQVDVTRTGKNLFDATESSQVIDGVTFTANDDGTVVANGTPSGTSRSSFLVGRYTITDNTVLLNGCPSGGSPNKFELMAFMNNRATSDFGSGNNLSIFSVGDTVSIFAIVRSGYTANNLVFKPMIRLASDTDATFEPYQGQSVTVNLGQTVYDGTLDVKTGTLTVDMAMVTLQDFTIWPGLYTTSGVKRLVSSNYLKGAIAKMCDTLQAFQTQSPVSDGTLNSIAITADGRFVITPSFIQSATTTDEAKTMLMAADPIHLVYELATPQTIQLSPAQLQLLTGTNVISTNADDLSVRYYASGKGTVEGSLVYLSDKKANTSTLATVESTSTASKAYTVGSYLVYNGILYRVTAAISAGHTLTPGTNISATNAGAELTSLNNGLKIVKYEGTHSISSNGNIVIDISSSIPSGKSLIAVLVVQLGVYQLPYMAQAGTSKFLYIEQVNLPQKTVKLKNTGTGDWNNYNVIITSVVG